MQIVSLFPQERSEGLESVRKELNKSSREPSSTLQFHSGTAMSLGELIRNLCTGLHWK